MRRGRTSGPGAHPRGLAAALLAAGALAGCGELATPDLERGNVAGRLVGGHNALAVVYPLGRPELAVRPDASGEFELEDLPAGPLTLVVYDGTIRAERLAVVVRGAERERLTLYGQDAAVDEARKLALGGRVVAAVLPLGGGLAVAPRLSIRGTTLRDVTAAGGAVAVGVVPVPEVAGTEYELTTELDGYAPSTLPISVIRGTSVYEVPMAPDAGGPAAGCAASGGQCRNGLRCDPADGLCYQCLGDADCLGGTTCDPDRRFCRAPTGGGAAVCSVCLADAQCGDPAAGAFCEKPGGAGDGDPDVAGYCTRSDQAASHPAGFELQPGPRGARWLAPFGCVEYFEEFGEGCFRNPTCASEDGDDGFALGFCHLADPERDRAGYCTAPCTEDADCILGGFACQLDQDLGQKVCTRAAATPP